jgi:hypothetical protein
MKMPPPPLSPCDGPPEWPEWKVGVAAFWPALIIICYLGWVAIPILVPLLLR